MATNTLTASAGLVCDVSDRPITEFERLLLPDLDAAYNFARLLTRNTQDAADVVQEAYLRAQRTFSVSRGNSIRPWILTLVRHTAFSWLRGTPQGTDHEEACDALEGCLRQLPLELREVIVLRELEALSYGEIAAITGVSRATVMSRLSRARARLVECLRVKGSSNEV